MTDDAEHAPLTGPVQGPRRPEAARARLTLAEQWLDSADRAGARSLGRG